MVRCKLMVCLIAGVFIWVGSALAEDPQTKETNTAAPQTQQATESKEGTTQQMETQSNSSQLSTPQDAPGEKELKEKHKMRLQALNMLMNQEFRYSLTAGIGNPFVPFVQPPQQKASPTEVAEGAPPPPVLLTPLQKMEFGEIERGFKGVLWTANERKAVIEDPTGKGYIVSVGTPIGNQDGVITAIFQDRIIIRQKVWDKTARAFKDEDVVVKLRKATEPGEKE
ncbi:MAG: pilus assembly protein PilP [Thermodesulforhabdaceae bacterium]